MMRIARPIPLLAGLLLAGGAVGQQPAQDPLKSPACGQALQALEAARAGGQAGPVEARRKEAARACLGGEPTGRTARPAQAPLTVPPPVIEPPAVRPVAPAPAAPPPVQIARPTTSSHCDAGGCWVNDGTHLRQVPRTSPAPCTPMGPTLYCP